MRTAEITRKTRETDITININIDGNGIYDIDTGIGFFDHMLTALCVHGGFDMTIKVKGDLQVDSHHTIEDTGIVLGQTLKKALGDIPLTRYGTASIPMDEALANCSLDISGRPFLVFNCDYAADMIGTMDCQMVEEFMRSFSFNAGITLHLNCPYGKNDHHKVEALFKALAHALKSALATKEQLLSTKGVL